MGTNRKSDANSLTVLATARNVRRAMRMIMPAMVRSPIRWQWTRLRRDVGGCGVWLRMPVLNLPS